MTTISRSKPARCSRGSIHATVRRGQRVTIDVDTFPGTAVHGYVDSLAPASGQEFALLPPDNATGNFTKIVQRIPVKVDVDKNDPLFGMLRPGMSVVLSIDPAGALHRAPIALGQTIRAEATIMGYADCFALLGVALVVAILPVALLRKGVASGGAAH